MADQGDDRPTPTVWIFHGDGAQFASGVFADRTSGLAWAERHGLTGVLTEYSVGTGTYDEAIATGRFRPSKPHHGSPQHVAGFSPAHDHVHLRDGRRGGQPAAGA